MCVCVCGCGCVCVCVFLRCERPFANLGVVCVGGSVRQYVWHCYERWANYFIQRINEIKLVQPDQLQGSWPTSVMTTAQRESYQHAETKWLPGSGTTGMFSITPLSLMVSYHCLVCVCVCSVHICVCVFFYHFARLYIYIYIYIYVYIYFYMDVALCVCVCVCLSVYLYVYLLYTFIICMYMYCILREMEMLLI